MRGIYRNAAHGEKKVLGILDSGMLQLFVFARLGAQGRIVLLAVYLNCVYHPYVPFSMATLN